MEIINEKNIKCINSEGIEYCDKNDQIQFISFHECNENWKNYLERKNIRSEELNIIGQRDAVASPRFIEFFGKPFIRFEFKNIDDNINERDRFNFLKNFIEGEGWKTIDLS